MLAAVVAARDEHPPDLFAQIAPRRESEERLDAGARVEDRPLPRLAARRSGVGGLLGDSHFDLGLFLQNRGRHKEAEPELTRARDLYAGYPWPMLTLPQAPLARVRALHTLKRQLPRTTPALLLTNSFSSALEMRLAGYGATFKPSFPPAAWIVPFAALRSSSAWTAQSPWVLAAT